MIGDIVEMVLSGELVLAVDTVYDLADAQAAALAVSRRHRSGKIALAATMGGRPTHHHISEDAPP